MTSSFLCSKPKRRRHKVMALKLDRLVKGQAFEDHQVQRPPAKQIVLYRGE